jgi:hypothetical protein
MHISIWIILQFLSRIFNWINSGYMNPLITQFWRRGENLEAKEHGHVWIKEGDNNTKFFHQFTNLCKNMNTIWEIRVVDGSMVCSFKDKVEEGVHHFKTLFQEPSGCPI